MRDRPRTERLRVRNDGNRRAMMRDRYRDGAENRRQCDEGAGMQPAKRALRCLVGLPRIAVFLRIRKLVDLYPAQPGERTDLGPTSLASRRRDRLRDRRRERIEQDREARDPAIDPTADQGK